ncbi:molybdopterin synthase sulfur carrier subunit [Candidatus Aerophobetes bacterium Ae_b3a]|nr:MAG: molybdopterin synthase sulfur carrier subunit [Candidatus Aerophobetes bacterium Ae_b3a]
METSQGNSVEDILHELKISSQRLSGLLIMANGTHSKLDYAPKDGDVISLFPAIAGG